MSHVRSPGLNQSWLSWRQSVISYNHTIGHWTLMLKTFVCWHGLQVLKLLKHCPEIVQELRQDHQYILVDEWQDCNAVQVRSSQMQPASKVQMSLCHLASRPPPPPLPPRVSLYMCGCLYCDHDINVTRGRFPQMIMSYCRLLGSPSIMMSHASL